MRRHWWVSLMVTLILDALQLRLVNHTVAIKYLGQRIRIRRELVALQLCGLAHPSELAGHSDSSDSTLHQHHLQLRLLACLVRIRRRSRQPALDLLKRDRLLRAWLANFGIENDGVTDPLSPGRQGSDC